MRCRDNRLAEYTSRHLLLGAKGNVNINRRTSLDIIDGARGGRIGRGQTMLSAVSNLTVPVAMAAASVRAERWRDSGDGFPVSEGIIPVAHLLTVGCVDLLLYRGHDDVLCIVRRLENMHARGVFTDATTVSPPARSSSALEHLLSKLSNYV